MSEELYSNITIDDVQEKIWLRENKLPSNDDSHRSYLRHKEMLEQRENLLEIYNKKEIYPPFDYKLLFEGILESLPLLSTEDMDQCILNRIPDNNENNNKLRFLQCKIGGKYKALPKTSDDIENIQNLFLREKRKISEGVYGVMVQSSVGLSDGKEEAVVVKIPKQWTYETIYEAFINFYIINRFVKEIHDLGDDYAQLVSSYGFFTCNQEKPDQPCNKENDIKNSSIINSYVYLIQQYIPSSITMQKYLSKKPGDTQNFIKILIKIFRTLSILQKSSFKVNHMDLHDGNILLGIETDEKTWNGKVWIIDWGRSSFTYKNKRFENIAGSIGEFYTNYIDNESIIYYEDSGGHGYSTPEFEINGALHDFNKIMFYIPANIHNISKIRIKLLSRLFPEYQDFIKKNSELLKIWGMAYDDKKSDITNNKSLKKIVDTMKEWTYEKIVILLQLILDNPSKNVEEIIIIVQLLVNNPSKNVEDIIRIINPNDFYDFRDSDLRGINFEGIDISDFDFRGNDVDLTGSISKNFFGFSIKKNIKKSRRTTKRR